MKVIVILWHKDPLRKRVLETVFKNSILNAFQRGFHGNFFFWSDFFELGIHFLLYNYE